LIGRISMLPRRAIGIFAATWMASFRCRASISRKPDSLPFRTRIVVALRLAVARARRRSGRPSGGVIVGQAFLDAGVRLLLGHRVHVVLDKIYQADIFQNPPAVGEWLRTTACGSEGPGFETADLHGGSGDRPGRGPFRIGQTVDRRNSTAGFAPGLTRAPIYPSDSPAVYLERTSCCVFQSRCRMKYRACRIRRPPVLKSRSCKLVSDQLWMARGRASRRSRLPRLWAMTPSSRRTSLARNR
jgi:hypothetical protein